MMLCARASPSLRGACRPICGFSCGSSSNGRRIAAAVAAFKPAAPRLPSASADRPRRRVAVMAAASGDASKTVLVPAADGTEDMELVIVVDVLRRAGAEVTVASVKPGSLKVTLARGCKLEADALISDVKSTTFDLIACPGGMPGAEHLRDCADLEDMVRAQRDGGRLYAAICATPVVFFLPKGLLGDAKATSHPAFSDKLPDQSVVGERVIVDGKLTTSRGPGTAFEWALSLVKQLYGQEKMEAVAGPMVMYPYKV